jgi:RNA polymerase sigma-70 factor (ECF subfamily)
VAGEDDADDVAQAALIAATRHIGAFDGRASLDTWLYRITRRCAADHFRRVRRLGLLASAMPPLPVTEIDFDASVLDARRAATVVMREFHRLPGRQREVFDLVDVQGRAAEEVAEVLRLAPSTVRVHLLRARRALRRIMLETEPALSEDLGGLRDRT